MFEGGFYNIFIKIFLRKEKEQKRTEKQKKLFPKIRKRNGEEKINAKKGLPEGRPSYS